MVNGEWRAQESIPTWSAGLPEDVLGDVPGVSLAAARATRSCPYSWSFQDGGWAWLRR